MDRNLEQLKIEANKWDELSKLRQGSIVELTTGENAEFIRLKQKKFIGIINGTTYDIPVSMFTKIISLGKVNDEYLKLKKGDYFYISNAKGDALLFIFDSIKNNKIIGINPITQAVTRIDCSLYKGKIK